MNLDAFPDDDIVRALQRLNRATDVPPPPLSRQAALLRAFDAGRTRTSRPQRIRGGWWLSALAGAAALLVSVVAPWGSPGARREAPQSPAGVVQGEFIAWPGAADLPPLESGELVRMDLPVSLLPSLGVAPPAGHVVAVKADVVIGQDGLARAVRFVGD